MEKEKKKKQQNNPGMGIEYEVYVPAFFALLLNNYPEIEDFTLRSNVPDFGCLDDLLIDITTKGGENLYFAFQLKHTDNSSKVKELLPTRFEEENRKGEKGPFNLEKYCKAFKELSEDEKKKYHFILHTNMNFNSSRTKNKVEKFVIKPDERCSTGELFDTSVHTNGAKKKSKKTKGKKIDTSVNGNNLYKFEVNEDYDYGDNGDNVTKKDYNDFFSKFSLYTGQADIRDLEKSILDILKYKESYARYIEFFRKWHRGDFTDYQTKSLDKKTLNVHLVDIFLSPFAINSYLSDGQDENSNFFEEMVQQFDITIINASEQDFINQLEENVHKYPEKFNKEDMILLAKDHKFIGRFSNELTEETKMKLLHYFHQKPLILDFNTKSQNIIYEVSELCRLQETGIKLVIMGKDIDVSKFSHLKIFANLRVDEHFLEETKKRCKLSLQGRSNISFEKIFEDEIREFVTPREIFQMLKGNFSLGEDTEKLPECYIPRTVSATVFDIESIIKHSTGSAAVIFYYEGKFEELKTLIQNIVHREDYLYEDFLDGIILRKKEPEPSKKQSHLDNSRETFPAIPAIILRRKECSSQQLDEIREKLREEESEKKDVHLFLVVDEKRCLLLMSTKKSSLKENSESTKITVKQNNIHTFFSKSVNILCAQPGMGKSTLMKYLKNECDPNFWTLSVDLKAHNQFLKGKHKIEDVLKYFLELEKCEDIFLLKTKEAFLNKQKIVFFLDGLDEVEIECVDYVLDITRQLSEMGFTVWLSSRQNLQQKIENYFSIFAVEIDEINENEQKEYIEVRLKSRYNKGEIEKIMEKIFKNTNLANNRQILEIPLQLHIITENFLEDKSYYSNLSENNFILTKMFEIFFQGKYNHFLTRIGLSCLTTGLTKDEVRYIPFLRKILEEQLTKYELVALHSVLDDEHLQKLKIENLQVTQSKDWDFLGIIRRNREIDNENKAVFEHVTFAEYFAAKFLVKNFDKARILKEEIFNEKYQNLLLIFNIMLAEDSPLHLAIIHKDFSRVDEELGQSTLVMDKGGRTFLQVAACVATRHPPLESDSDPFSSECLVNDESVKHFEGEDLTIKRIVSRVLPDAPFKIDNIFEWNSMDYALASGALYMVEAILEKFEKPPNFYEVLVKYYSDEVVAYYSIRFGYHRLLFEILAKKSCHVSGIHSNYLWSMRLLYRNNSIFNFLFVSSYCTNRSRFVELLCGDDVNKAVYDADGYTFLHFAVLHGDTEFIKFLLGKDADLNVKDKNGRSPLFLAVERNNLEISKLLIEKGADVNIKDKNETSTLFWAVERNNLEISKLLVEKGADVNNKNDYGRSSLFFAVDKNDVEISKWLVEKGADVNSKDINGESPVFWAVKGNNHEILKWLVEKGADINIKDKDGWSPLFWAVQRDSLETSKLLIEKGADVNFKDEDGWSPLLLAVRRNKLEISKLLVEKGADVHFKDKDGWSPLFWAVRRDSLETSKLLVEKGADVNFRDEDGWSPLHIAVFQNNFEISKLLAEKGADINTQSKSGAPSLYRAAERNILENSKFEVEKGEHVRFISHPVKSLAERNDLEISEFLVGKGTSFRSVSQPVTSLAKRNDLAISKFLGKKGADDNIKDEGGCSPILSAVKQDNLEISKLLIEKGANVNIKDEDGWSPLLWAVRRNNLEISRLLVEKGADVNIKDKNKTSTLYWAAEQNSLEISKLLVKKGADVNIKDKDGWSPLLWAVRRNNLEISELLVEKGADINVQDKDGWSALFVAVKLNNLVISKLLIGRGADVNINNKYRLSPLLLATNRNNFEISKLLIEKGADINSKDEDGWSALFWAVKRSNHEISKLLVEKGADVNIKDKNKTSTLYWAAEQNNFEISKLLVEKGADVNIRDKDGWSPLLWAVRRNNLEISELLIEKGADVNIKDKNQTSTLYWAAEENNLEISKLLVKKGADVNIRDKDGWSPLLWAVRRNNLEISRLLVEKGADVNIKDKEDWSPLFWAIEENNLDILKLLFDKGADININNKYWLSPLIFAIDRNNFEISKLLIEEGAYCYVFRGPIINLWT